MKFYSEQLKKFFDTAEECLAEETKAENAKKIEEEELKKVQTLEKEYAEELAAFVEKYGYYKSEVSIKGISPDKYSSAYNALYRLFK